MEPELLGREEEQQILLDALNSREAEMVAVFGRRRVGKTFLVKQTYGERIAFELTGLQHASNADQLQNFSLQLTERMKLALPVKIPTNWLEAFYLLANFLREQPADQRSVIFFDEVPWLAGHKSGFLMGLSWFWNSFAVTRQLVVVICGSAASWMIQKIVNDRGGLHNRITKRVFLKPFTLAETEQYLHHRNVPYNRYQIAQIYMALGGIPHYLKAVEAGKSAAQNISDICFSPNGLLRDEFTRLYPALFAHADNHIAVVRVLAQSRQGISRPNIVKLGKLPEGGSTSKILEELEQSGFITAYYPFGKKKKDVLYRLTDEYSLFYLRFIEKNKEEGRDIWQLLSQTQAAKIWNGYAYENLCLKHLQPIKKVLGIAGVYAIAATFLHRGDEQDQGAQIDLLLDRNDQVINLFEIKFYTSEYTLTEAEAKALRHKMGVFQQITGTRKYLMMSMITTFGLKHNKHSLGLVEKVLTLEDLFE
ncbi:MAG: ATP-binding protein [Saprospiraceae bacterium]|nr:ATP-binding protein [Saprospiraceae bacterium]